MNVLSLFDGISCGQESLKQAGLEINNYYAAEIDKYAIQVTQNNYPNTIQLGDVRNVTVDQLPKIDLLIGGSPCQDLSVYKFDRGDVKGLEGKKSNLFYQYERLLKELKPTWFLLENVPMQKEWENIITEILGVKPIMINSNLVSAQRRKRLYWTNIPGIEQPKAEGLALKDVCISADDVEQKYWYDKEFTYNGSDKKVEATIHINGHRNMKEVYNLNNECNTLLCDGDGGHRVKKVFQDGKIRKLTPLEYERLQTLPDNYTKGLSDSRRYSAIGNGWNVKTTTHIFNYLKFVNH